MFMVPETGNNVDLWTSVWTLAMGLPRTHLQLATNRTWEQAVASSLSGCWIQKGRFSSNRIFILPSDKYLGGLLLIPWQKSSKDRLAPFFSPALWCSSSQTSQTSIPSVRLLKGKIILSWAVQMTQTDTSFAHTITIWHTTDLTLFRLSKYSFFPEYV